MHTLFSSANVNEQDVDKYDLTKEMDNITQDIVSRIHLWPELSITEKNVRDTLCRIQPNKAKGPDNLSGRLLKECGAELAPVFSDIFQSSLHSHL